MTGIQNDLASVEAPMAACVCVCVYNCVLVRGMISFGHSAHYGTSVFSFGNCKKGSNLCCCKFFLSDV